MNHAHLPLNTSTGEQPVSSTASDDLLAERAFRYVAGELTEAELNAFERQLDQDQTAREAVATAIEWTQAVWTVDRTTSTPREDLKAESTIIVARRPHSPITIALATAGLLLLALALVPLLRPSDSRSARQLASASPEQQLALAWNRVRQDSPNLESVAGDQRETTDDDVADGDATTTDSSANTQPGEEVEAPPSWIMAAVSAVAEQQADSPATPATPDHEDL